MCTHGNLFQTNPECGQWSQGRHDTEPTERDQNPTPQTGHQEGLWLDKTLCTPQTGHQKGLWFDLLFKVNNPIKEL